MPDVHYARSGDVAYQVLGDGPIDLVFVPFLENLYATWQYPPFVRFYKRLSEFSRLILLDKLWSGLSDRPRGVPTLEMQMDDVRAVLDEVRSKRAALLGAFQGAQMCTLFAATYPERVRALALYCPHASMDRLPAHHTQPLEDIRRGWAHANTPVPSKCGRGLPRVVRQRAASCGESRRCRRVLSDAL